MKIQLEETIVKFILHKLGVFDDVDGTSIINSSFLIDDQLYIFEDIKSKLYGLCSKLSDVNINIFCVDLSEPDEDDPYYIIIVDLKDLPTYALYCDGLDCLKLFCKTENGGWMKTIPFLQASFLAGMEQLHSANLEYSKSEKELFNREDVISLIRFIDAG